MRLYIFLFSLILSFSAKSNIDSSKVLPYNFILNDTINNSKIILLSYDTCIVINKFIYSDSTIISKYKKSFFKNDTAFNFARFSIVGESTFIALIGSYDYLNNALWAGSRTSFHFDGGSSNILKAFDFGRNMIYAKGLDKLGHFYGGRIAGDFFFKSDALA